MRSIKTLTSVRVFLFLANAKYFKQSEKDACFSYQEVGTLCRSCG